MKYIDAEKLIAEIERRMEDCKLPDGRFPTTTNIVRYEELSCLRNFITSLQQEQPDNEDIDKVAQELYEHLYELKRRNNVPTNLYEKQEIIDLWKAGIEYAYNHPKQGQPMPDSTKLIELWQEDKEMLKEKDFRDDPWRLAYNAFMYGFGRGIAVKKQEQPEVDLEKEIKDKYSRDTSTLKTREQYAKLARHFYELGLNARKEE